MNELKEISCDFCEKFDIECIYFFIEVVEVKFQEVGECVEVLCCLVIVCIKMQEVCMWVCCVVVCLDVDCQL